MLDLFLERVCETTKQAEATDRMQQLLNKLPSATLMKIASCATMGVGGGGGNWLDQFRGTPLLDQAIEIEKAELEIQMEDAKRQQARNELDQQHPWGVSDMQRQELQIKRKLLELELVGAESGGPSDDDLIADEAEMSPEMSAPKAEAPVAEVPVAGPPAALEEKEAPPAIPAELTPKDEKKPPVTKVTKETTEKPAPEKVDIKTAAARMRFSMAAQLLKEAQPADRAGAFRRGR